MKIHGFVILSLMMLVITGCGERTVAINFKRELPVDSIALSDITKALSSEGISVTETMWEADDAVKLKADSELDSEAFDEHVAKALQPFIKPLLAPASMIVLENDADKNLDYFELEQGQRFPLQPDWKSADFGNYITFVNMSTLSAVVDVTKQCVCGVKVPLKGKIPAFLLAQIPVKTDLINDVASQSSAALNVYLLASKIKYNVEVEVEMDRGVKDKSP